MANKAVDAERMADFFDRRAASYDRHMRQSVAGFSGRYRSVAIGIERSSHEVNPSLHGSRDKICPPPAVFVLTYGLADERP